jgi:hypothetical protein
VLVVNFLQSYTDLYGTLMTTLNEFRKNHQPAHHESEKAYFLRLSAEYTQLNKREARLVRNTLWMNRLTTMARLVVSKPNLLRLS